MAKKRLIIEQDILKLVINGTKKFELEGNELFTPAAKDKIREAKITLVKKEKSVNSEIKTCSRPFSEFKKIAVGCDHTGFKTKKIIINFLSEKGYEIQDVGTNNEESCDYPDFAIEVGKLVQTKKVSSGILFDATGIPSAITANKLKGIRAATCYNEFTAQSAREHNNANIIVLGAKTLGEETIKSILNVWLKSKFLGDRHQRRLDKISRLEK